MQSERLTAFAGYAKDFTCVSRASFVNGAESLQGPRIFWG
jgi:hypothetical protein